MFFKLFRKAPAEVQQARFEQDPDLAEALARRVEAIRFRPTKGFLKDRPQPKRAPTPPRWTHK
jgi:hypothetical protein